MHSVQHRYFFPLILFFAFSSNLVTAQQRVTFESLAASNRAAGIHFDFIYQPTSDGQTEITIIYRIRHTFLSFRRQLIETQAAPRTQFTSDVDITFDFYDGETPPVPDRPFLKRETWKGSVTVPEYAETQDADRFLLGLTTLVLPGGSYRMIPTIQVNGRQVSGIQMASGNAPNPPRMSRRQVREREEAERRRGILEVPNFTESNRFEIALLESSPSEDPAVLMNLGRNVRYAQDYQLLISAPSVTTADSVTVRLFDHGAMNSPRTPNQTPLWTKNLSEIDPWGTGQLRFSQSEMGTLVLWDAGQLPNRRHFRVDVPNYRFPNSWFEAEIVSWSNGIETVGGSLRYLALWQNIPTSLLNLDLAIDMMRFVVDRDVLREMRRGTQAEREVKFRSYWKERDPTPDTDFNELMAEYYRRVDFAHRTFTTPAKPGIDSDQGRIYIVYGPPDAIERMLPPGGTPAEVWTYGTRTFIFRATSGFGDFELVPSN